MKKESRIKDLYHQSKILIPELDARIIIKYVLDLDDAVFYRDIDRKLSIKQINHVQKLVIRRAQGEPIAYLLGNKEFFNLDFKVDENVLIPRPETEELVEKSIKFLKSIKKKEINVIDIGTGSGNIIVTIAKTRPGGNYFASDISQKALDVAKANAKRHNVKIKLYKSDLFQNIPKQKFDLIIANLPYVPKNGSDVSTKFEPQDAIFADDNGTSIIKRFLLEAKDRLNNNGAILLELDPRNAVDIKKLAHNIYRDFEIELKKDLAKRDRYLFIRSSRV